jgi:hypothetical protein
VVGRDRQIAGDMVTVARQPLFSYKMRSNPKAGAGWLAG